MCVYTYNDDDKKRSHFSVLESDFSDKRHTFVLHPCVRQVKVCEWAEIHHVRNGLSYWLVDNIIATEPLGLRHLTEQGKKNN